MQRTQRDDAAATGRMARSPGEIWGSADAADGGAPDVTSSWLVARASGSERVGDMVATRRWLLLALTVASGFGLVKAVEYTRAISSGHADLGNEFFTFYFALTGVHLFHYLIGMGVLAYLAIKAGTTPHLEGELHYRRLLDGGALFWHMVDLLWISLFAMLYLIGAR